MPGGKYLLSTFARVVGNSFIGFLAIALIMGGFSKVLGPPVTPKDIPVVTLTGTLAANPEIISHGKLSRVRLLLNEFPKRSFNINDDAFAATKWGMISDYENAGDTVILEVSADDYKNNIEPQQRPERMLAVAVYAFRSREHVYLTVADYCTEANSNGWIGVVCIIFGCGFAFALYHGLWKKKKKVKA